YWGIEDLQSWWVAFARQMAADEPLYARLPDQIRLAPNEPEAYRILQEALQKHGRKLVVFLDNLHEWLRRIDDSGSSHTEAHRLRSILMLNPDMRIVGAAPFMLKEHYDYQHPFFGFFTELRLQGLSSIETVNLMRYLAQQRGQEEHINQIIADQP